MAKGKRAAAMAENRAKLIRAAREAFATQGYADAAMDELAGMQGTETSARQAQFLSVRETIERIASDLYDEASRFPGYVVRIFMRHLTK